jgi:Fe-S oxidoreductase
MLSKLREYEDEMKKCFRCSLCKMIPLPTITNSKYSDGCPAVRKFHFHGYSGSGKNIMALSLIDRRIEVDERLADVVYACTACGLCDVSCKFIMEAERHLVNMALRETIVEEGFSLPVHQKTIENLKKYNNPNGKPQQLPANWANGLKLKQLPREKAKVLLFAGCLQSMDSQSAGVVQKLAKILMHAKIDIGILGDGEPSCGLPAYWTGHRDHFINTINTTTDLLNSTNVQTIVTASGSCLGSLRSKYAEYQKAPKAKVLHATEFISRLIKNGRLRLPRPVRRNITYHDPCYLGRQSEPPVKWEGEHKMTHGCMTYTDPPKPINRGVNGVFDAPRHILNSIDGLTFNEMYRIREYSFCCGGGGGVAKAYPELAKASALHRIDEAIDVGADFLVTACHQCRMNLSNAQTCESKKSIPIIDIIDLVYEAAGLDG